MKYCKDRFFFTGQTEDIFKVICDELGVPLPKDLVSKNFPYLVHEWIGKKYEMEVS